jgi:hypothetical protein
LVGLAGKCLDANASGAIDLWDCTGAVGQSWQFTAGTLRGDSGACLEVVGGPVNGASLRLSSCTGASNQQWSQEGRVVVGPAGRCLDVSGGGSKTANGTAVELWDCTGWVNQQWKPGGAQPSSGNLPARVLTTYYWPFGTHPTIATIQAAAPSYNVLSYVSAMPSGNGNADMVLNGGAEPDLASMISGWKASGRVALIMVGAGGANGVGINLFTSADAAHFVDTMSVLIDTYGFQGVDWDLEDSFTQSSSAAVVEATGLLKAKYGSGFIISAVPRSYEVRDNGIWAQCMKAMLDQLDLIGLQEYDNAAYADPSYAQIKTDYADLMGQGFPAAKVLLGTSTFSGVSVSGGAASPSTYAAAFNDLEAAYGIRGAFVWQSSSDRDDSPSWSYGSTLGAVVVP